MYSRKRISFASALVLCAAIAAACVSTKLPEGATLEHRYFAALADYNILKQDAIAYATLPSTTVQEAEKILDVVVNIDLRIDEFEAVRSAGTATAGDFQTISQLLQTAANTLRPYTETQ